MKKILILSIVVLFFVNAKSQSVNGTPISEINTEYLQIVGTSKLFSTKVSINIDFGQSTKFFKTGESTVLDETGNALTLNSMIDALNFMSKNGYEFIQAYVITLDGNQVYHYLMKKKK